MAEENEQIPTITVRKSMRATPKKFTKTPTEEEVAGLSRYTMPATSATPRAGAFKEVRKPESGTRRVFRAMVQGEPAKDQIFETKEEAEKYLKDTGAKGVVAGIAFKGKTGEEIAQKEQAYRGGLQAEKTRKSDLEKLYATRKEQATERVGRIREAAADYDAATTPAQKEAARGRAEAARLEGMLEETTRRMPQEQKQKVAAGLAGVLQRRGEREARVQRETAQARAERQAERDVADIKKEGLATERQYQSILKPLYKASREARRKRNFALQYELENEIEAVTSGVPQDPRARRDYFVSGAGEEWKNRLAERAAARAEYEAREKSRRNSNPTYY